MNLIPTKWDPEAYYWLQGGWIEGGVTFVSPSSGATAVSLLGVNPGAWYVEITVQAVSGGTGSFFVGVLTTGGDRPGISMTAPAGGVIGVVLDLDACTLTLYLDGVECGYLEDLQVYVGWPDPAHLLLRHDTNSTTTKTNFGAEPFTYGPPPGVQPGLGEPIVPIDTSVPVSGFGAEGFGLPTRVVPPDTSVPVSGFRAEGFGLPTRAVSGGQSGGLKFAPTKWSAARYPHLFTGTVENGVTINSTASGDLITTVDTVIAGKWYFEVTVETISGYPPSLEFKLVAAYGEGYLNISNLSVGDVIGCELDLDDVGGIWRLYKNGVLKNWRTDVRSNIEASWPPALGIWFNIPPTKLKTNMGGEPFVYGPSAGFYPGFGKFVEAVDCWFPVRGFEAAGMGRPPRKAFAAGMEAAGLGKPFSATQPITHATGIQAPGWGAVSVLAAHKFPARPVPSPIAFGAPRLKEGYFPAAAVRPVGFGRVSCLTVILPPRPKPKLLPVRGFAAAGLGGAAAGKSLTTKALGLTALGFGDAAAAVGFRAAGSSAMGQGMVATRCAVRVAPTSALGVGRVTVRLKCQARGWAAASFGGVRVRLHGEYPAHSFDAVGMGQVSAASRHFVQAAPSPRGFGSAVRGGMTC